MKYQILKNLKRSLQLAPILIAFLAFVVGCQTLSESPAEKNNPPIIYSIYYWTNDSLRVEVGDTVTIQCNANDLDNDPLRYKWEAWMGGIIVDSTFRGRWLAMSTDLTMLDTNRVDTASIIVRVSDRWATTVDTAKIIVAPRGTYIRGPRVDTLIISTDTVEAMDTVVVSARVRHTFGFATKATFWVLPDSGVFLDEDTTYQYDSVRTVRWVSPRTPNLYTLGITLKDTTNRESVKYTSVRVVPLGTFNRPPSIDSIRANPSIVARNATTTITAYVSDMDDSLEFLNFNWYARSGNIVQTSDPWVINWTAPNDTGIYYIRLTVSDPFRSDIDSIPVRVTYYDLTNQPPVIDGIYATPLPVVRNTITQIRCVARDPDNRPQPLSYQWFSNWGTFISTTTDSIVSWQAPQFIGTYYVRCQVSDGERSVLDSILIPVINPINYPPTIVSISASPSRTNPNDTVSLSCIATDPNGDLLSYYWSSTAGILLENTFPNVNWIAPPYDGVFTISCMVSDGVNSVQDSVSVIVSSTFRELYSSAFDSDMEVLNQWAATDTLSGLSTTSGMYILGYSYTNLAMEITARGVNSTFGFQLTNRNFNHATYQIAFSASDRNFSKVGILPKFVNNRTYLYVGVNYVTSVLEIIQVVNGVLVHTVPINLPTMQPNRFYTIACSQNTNQIQVSLNGQIWYTGQLHNALNTQSPFGVAVNGALTSGTVLFDNLLIFNP